MNVYKYFVVEMEDLYTYGKVATVGPQQWMEQVDISYTADSTDEFGVVEIETPDVLSCSVSFYLASKKVTEETGQKYFQPFCSYFGCTPRRLFAISEIYDCLFPYTK